MGTFSLKRYVLLMMTQWIKGSEAFVNKKNIQLNYSSNVKRPHRPINTWGQFQVTNTTTNCQRAIQRIGTHSANHTKIYSIHNTSNK